MTRWVVLLTAAAQVLSGCGSSGSQEPAHVRLFAAQSLAPVMSAIESAYERDHDDIVIDASFAGSSLLATQIIEGAEGDVFVSADEPTMKRVVDAGLVRGEPTIVAHNVLEIIVPRDNPKGITGLVDLTRAGTRVAMCDVGVPCGRYAHDAFAKAGARVPAASQEANVAGVVTKVAAGEADAGIVYATDVRAAGEKVLSIAIPPAANVVARYPSAVLKASVDVEEARTFVRFLRSDEARRIFLRFGFLQP